MSTREEEHPYLVPGHRLDRYELLCPIASGGMARVWLARLLGKHDFERLVAIKTILPSYARDPQVQKMFLDEARIASGIRHPNVAQILDLGESDGILFIAMEWVDGDSLSKLARAVVESAHPFPQNIALRILADVCAGLHAAHELTDRNGTRLEIVHRDVSPQNILITGQGVSKLIDFGVAKARGRAGGDTTKTGSFKGKIKYMAPEQALSPRSTDRRADVWAVGAILYSLLSGRSPYEGEDDIQIIAQFASKKSPRPLSPPIPPPIRAVARRALAWAPEDRYATAEELRVAIEVAMLEASSSATPADVAAFCAHHLAGHTLARRQSLAMALSEADDRESARRPTLPGVAAQSALSVAPMRLAALPWPSPGRDTSLTLGTPASMTTNSPARVMRGGRWRTVAAWLSRVSLASPWPRWS